VSTTDHEARVMKMADGGFRPAFNAQLAVDTATLIITGVDLINSGSDMNRKRSGNPSFVGAMKLRALHLGNQRDEVENGSTADGAVPEAREGVSGIGTEGQGVGRSERRADAFVGELVRAFATLAGTA